jgi:uncharacterized protein YceK
MKNLSRSLKTIFTLLIIGTLGVSCSSIKKTYIDDVKKGEKVFAGTKNNIDWVSKPPKEKVYPYTVMGIIDFPFSIVGDILFLPYTLYDKYSDSSDKK